MRLDQAIAARHPDISRRKARDLIAAHRVLVNERVVSVASREVKESDRISIVEALPEIRVIARHADWIAVEKPAGISTQPDRDRARRSLEELVRVHLKSAGERSDLWIVHRIDTPTSGVVVFARNPAAASRLSRKFASREVKKTYAAVVDGVIDRELVLDAPIEGKDARTIVRPVKVMVDRTLLEVQIETGRMHQIRIHLSGAGHPVSGDRRYGSSSAAPRPLLHAWKLEVPGVGAFEAGWPEDFPRETEFRIQPLPVC